MPSWLYEAGPYGLVIFVVVTLGLGGLAAFVSGRALALTWRSLWQVPVYMLLLAFAVRFIHFAIFGEVLLSLRNYIVDYAVVLGLAMMGYKHVRRNQMSVQYGWRAPSSAKP